MKPLGRQAFIGATLGCLVFAALTVANFIAFDHLLTSLFAGVGLQAQITAGLAMVMIAGALALGLWTWFAARRFVTLASARWPTVLPITLWVLGFVVLILALQVFDHQVADSFADVRSPDRPQGIERALRDEQVRRYTAFFSLALVAMGLVTAAWCTARGAARDPVPIEDHFT